MSYEQDHSTSKFYAPHFSFTILRNLLHFWVVYVYV